MRILILAAVVLAQAASQPQSQVIRSGVTYVSTDLAVRDERGQFVADLARADFEVLEDGVRQELVTFVLTHGGRVITETPPIGAAAPEGILLPPARPPNDVSGRIFLIFVDDHHLSPRSTPRVRDLLKKISSELIHEGDLFGIVSSGYSSVAIDMTYDRKRFAQAIEKITGGGLSPSEVIGAPQGAQGPPEVRHRAHVALSTAYEILQKFEQVHDRRKAFIYISEGYDFDPFSKSREKAAGERYPADVPAANPFSKTGNEFAAADLAAELSELTRAANRANTTIYTIDPRGLVAGPDIDQTTLDSGDWLDHVRETQSSLRVIAELTGGIPVVNRNDFTRALKRIDNDTSDYYVLGYYSSNPDPLQKIRRIEITVKSTAKRRADRYHLTYKTTYTLKPQ